MSAEDSRYAAQSNDTERRSRFQPQEQPFRLSSALQVREGPGNVRTPTANLRFLSRTYDRQPTAPSEEPTAAAPHRHTLTAAPTPAAPRPAQHRPRRPPRAHVTGAGCRARPLAEGRAGADRFGVGWRWGRGGEAAVTAVPHPSLSFKGKKGWASGAGAIRPPLCGARPTR